MSKNITTLHTKMTPLHVKPTTLHVKITLLEGMLGTKACGSLFEDYIASKCPDDDLRKQELETAEHEETNFLFWHAFYAERISNYIDEIVDEVTAQIKTDDQKLRR